MSQADSLTPHSQIISTQTPRVCDMSVFLKRRGEERKTPYAFLHFCFYAWAKLLSSSILDPYAHFLCVSLYVSITLLPPYPASKLWAWLVAVRQAGSVEYAMGGDSGMTMILLLCAAFFFTMPVPDPSLWHVYTCSLSAKL